jgi:hypothetical protein
MQCGSEKDKLLANDWKYHHKKLFDKTGVVKKSHNNQDNSSLRANFWD